MINQHKCSQTNHHSATNKLGPTSMNYVVALRTLLTATYYSNFMENKLLPSLEDAPLTDTQTNVVT
jgi:hypothetical protein